MLKKLHPEFQSDIYIIFEALNVQLFVQTDAMTQKLFSLDEFLKLKNKKLIITSFQFKSYPIERFTFQTYKVFMIYLLYIYILFIILINNQFARSILDNATSSEFIGLCECCYTL